MTHIPSLEVESGVTHDNTQRSVRFVLLFEERVEVVEVGEYFLGPPPFTFAFFRFAEGLCHQVQQRHGHFEGLILLEQLLNLLIVQPESLLIIK